MKFVYRVYQKKRNLGISQEITLQFLSIKDFMPPRIEIELLIDHITVNA